MASLKTSLGSTPAALVLVCLALVAEGAHAADPTIPECLAASEGSRLQRRQHKLRAARTQLLICSASSCPADIQNECALRMAEANTALPTIVFDVKDPGGRDLLDVRVAMDGEFLAEGLDGSALPVDSGAHEFTFEAPGQLPLKKGFVVREGEKNRYERITLIPTEPAPSEVREPPPLMPTQQSLPAAVVPKTSGSNPEHAGARDGSGARRVWSLGLIGAGVVGLGVGAGFGLQAMSKHGEANKACPGQTCSDQNGVNLWNQAVTAGTVSTVGFIVGAVAMTGGVLLWTTDRSSANKARVSGRTQVGLGLGSVQLRGSW